MKKSLIALAVVGAFAGAAQAQSSVSVYGLYDGGYNALSETSTTTAGATTRGQTAGFTGNASASSRLGFRGTEDLGGGLRAFFNYELAITPGSGILNTTSGTTGETNANSSAAPRTSIVGIASNQLGSVAFGRQLTGIHGVVAGDVWGGNNMVGDMTYSAFYSTTTTSPQNFSAVNAVSARVSNNFTRLDNLVVYNSPTFAGFSLRADYANNTLTSDGQPGIQTAYNGLTAAFNWKQFTLKAGTATTITNEALAISSSFTANKTVINAANAMFKQGPITVQYTYAINETTNKTTGVQASQVKAQKLSASYMVTPVIMGFVQYGMGGTEMTKSASAVNNQTEDKALQAGVEYSFSKRSSIYAAYGTQERKQIGTTAKVTMDQVAAGLRHTF